ncbi:MAG: phosphatase PAP2 family protein [Bacteroidales bacterium]|nr:phosphatase PAP2 family protein [Bacteroidales bacterium]
MKNALLVYSISGLVLLSIGVGLLYTYPKLELHCMLNSYHTGFLDFFFKCYSFLAECPLYVFMLIPLFFKKYRITIFFAISELTAGAISYVLKQSISMERPLRAFETRPDLTFPFVEGVDLHSSNSFPSGHSSTFFVFCTVWAIVLAYRYQQTADPNDRKAKIKIILTVLGLLIFAALGAYSRVYLSQHFLSDVCVGSIIGFSVTHIVYFLGKNKLFKSQNKE